MEHAGACRSPRARTPPLQMDLDVQPRSPFPWPWIRRFVITHPGENASRLLRAGLDFYTWLAELDEALILEMGRNANFPLHPPRYWTRAAGRQAVGPWAGLSASRRISLTRGAAGVEPGCRECERRRERRRALKRRLSAAAKMCPASMRPIEELFAADFELFRYERLSRRPSEPSGRDPIMQVPWRRT